MADRKTLELQIQLIADRASTQLKTFATDIKHAAENAKGFSGDSKKVATSIATLQDEAKKTATSIKLFGGNTNELRNTTARMKATILDLIQGGLKPESQEVQNLVQQYKQLENEIENTERQQQGFMGFIDELKKGLGEIAVAAAALAVDKALVGFAAGALEVNNSFQAARDNFGIMLNDMEAGRGLFNELQEFNFWTPFDIETTAQATAVLRTAKVELGDITKYLTRFGDLSRGNAQTMQSFTNAFSKASAKGKADMEVLNVFIDQGVQILDQLAKQMGTTSAQIVKMASEGKISFADLDQAIAELTSEGGQYYNTMATAAMRLDAVQAGLEESTKSLRASFGEMLAPAISKVLTFMTSAIDLINNSPILKGTFAAAIAVVTTAINILALKAIAGLVAQLLSAYAAQMALNTAAGVLNPIVAGLTIAVGAATLGFTAYAASQQKAADATAANALEMKKLREEAADTSWLDNVSLSNVENTVKMYRSQIVPAAKEMAEAYQKELEKTPKKITKTFNDGRGNRTVTYDNPEYKTAQKAAEDAQRRLDLLQEKADAIDRKYRQMIDDEQKAIAEFGTEWQDKVSGAIDSIDIDQMKSVEKLNRRAEDLLKGNYRNNEAYQKELTALNEFYSNKRQEHELENIRRQEHELEKLAEKRRKALNELAGWRFADDPIAKIESEKSQALERLSDAAKTLYGDLYNADESYIRAATNLSKSYTRQAQSVIDSANLGLAQYLTGLKDLVAIDIERRNAMHKLADDARVLFGENYEQEKDYVEALANLEKYYDQQIYEAKLRQLNNYWALNRAQIAYSAKKSAAQAMQGSDLQTIMSSGNIWVALIQIIFKAVSSLESFQKAINFVSEALKEVFSAIEPELKKGMEIIEGVIDEFVKVLKPIFALVVAISNNFTETLSTVLNPLFDILGDILEKLVDLWNEVLVPVSQIITPILNRFFSAVGKFTGINLQLAELQKITYATVESASETEKAQELLQKKYQRLISAVNDTLRSQLDALQSQYELGLISRQKYEEEAEKYQQAADEKQYELEQEMNKKLETIAEETGKTAQYTLAALSAEQKINAGLLGDLPDLSGHIENGINGVINGGDPTSILAGILGGDWRQAITGALTAGLWNTNANVWENIANLATGGLYNAGKSGVTAALTAGLWNTKDSLPENITNLLTGGLFKGGNKIFGSIGDFFSGVGNLFSGWWDVGSTEIPKDQFGMVHKGETIIPKTFAQGIRNGDLALVGRNGNKNEGGNYIINLNIGGSVVTENQIVDSVYRGIAEGIRQRRYNPLPGGTA